MAERLHSVASEPVRRAESFNRPPRQPLPVLPPGEIDIPAPPPDAPPPAQNWLIAVIPSLGMGVMALFYVWRSVTVPGSGGLFVLPLFILAGFTIGGTILAQRWRSRDYQRRLIAARLDYIRLLEKKRARLQAAHTAQIALLEATFPRPRDSLDIALTRDPRLWERRPEDAHFAAFRLGSGAVPSAVGIKAPDPDASSPELERALQIVNEYRFLRAAPVIASLRSESSIGICGRRDQIIALTNAILCQLALSHAPTDLHLHLIAADAQVWRWLTWLPHIGRDPDDSLAFDSRAARRLLGSLSRQVEQRARQASPRHLPHLLLVVDEVSLADGEDLLPALVRSGEAVGAAALFLAETYERLPSDCAAVIRIEPDGSFTFTRTERPSVISGVLVEQMTPDEAEYSARALASVQIGETGATEQIPRRVHFLDLYNARDAESLLPHLRSRWGRDIADGVLPFPVPIGRESLSVETLLLLDEDHHGPHGLLAGTTGGGKSELLQTLVCALAIEHDPRLVNFLLIDFKGGSTFNIFAGLPHTVGMVTNLDGLLVERALEALRAETRARQQFFKERNVRDITQYHRVYARGLAHLRDDAYRPLPHLFIIVDEFAQLAREMPDFLHELVRTAQVGRSLGLHLILATQSPMDVITDEMNANMQFRICLRVQSTEASRAVLHRPEAAYIAPGLAGRGYLQVGEQGIFKQFQAAYAGGDQRSGQARTPTMLELVNESGDIIDLLSPSGRRSLSLDEAPADMSTTAALVVATIADYAHKKLIPPPPPLLLPPLPDALALDVPFDMMRAGGWDGRTWLPAGYSETGMPIPSGSAPVGVVDDVTNGRQFPLWLHFNRLGGHLLIVGAVGSGKTTALQTLALALARLHSPDTLHLYLLSLKGTELKPVDDFPHAEQIVQGSEGERIRRLFERLLQLLGERQQRGGGTPIIIVCIDQYEQFRDLFYHEHHADFERLLSEGGAVGIYLVVTASSASSLPERLRPLFPQRLVLQPGGVGDTLLLGDVPKLPAGSLPKGRGLVNPSGGQLPLMCQVSLPVLDDALSGLAAAMRAAFGRRQSPAPLRELPAAIPLDSLPLPAISPHLQTTLGRRDDDTLSPFVFDWDAAGRHVVVTGTAGAGKTNLLIAAALAAAQQFPPEQLRFLLIDLGGRSLEALAALKHVIGRVTNVRELTAQLRLLGSEMDNFSAHEPSELPRTIIIIDDYEIAADVFSIQRDWLRQLRDHIHLHTHLGVHFWVAGYLDRMSDPFIKQILRRRVGFVFGGKEGLHDFNVRPAALPTIPMPPGRAYLVRQHTVEVVQIALAEHPMLVVRRLNEQVWADSAAATWQANPPAVPFTSGQNRAHAPLDIDTTGLIEDLFGDAPDTD